MNDPESAPVDIVKQRNWLMAHKNATGASWPEISRQVGVPYGTISQFGNGGYKGNNEEIAKKIFRFRQHLALQADLAVEAPEIPGYFQTTTSKRIISLLTWAHKGRITVISTGAGLGKTESAKHYKASVSNVWMATLSPSTSGLQYMQAEVLAALGQRDAVGTPQKLSHMIRERVKGTGGLLILDEAQWAGLKAVEEIRSWHDATGIGIAILGNTDVITRLEGGQRKAAYAQLYSRVGMRLVQNLPHPDDTRALAEAWNIEDDKLIAYIAGKAQMPGGLRGVTMTIELGTMIAASEGQPLSLNHLQDAWAQLSARPLAA